MRHVVFCHGKDSSPRAQKIQWLMPMARDAGLSVSAPDFGRESPEERVRQLLAHVAEQEAEVDLVGSSMGGLISVVCAQRAAIGRLFLMAPAVYMPGYEDLDYQVATPVNYVVHGWNDTIVPVASVFRFAQEHKARLIMVDDDHRLGRSRGILESSFREFLQQQVSAGHGPA